MSRRHSISIGLNAYSVTANLVFVRVPNEPGRWMLTDRCVVEVACPLCGSAVGEPCRRHYDTGPRYHVGTHTWRRSAGRNKHGGNYLEHQPYPKLRLRPDELQAPYEEPQESQHGFDPTFPG